MKITVKNVCCVFCTMYIDTLVKSMDLDVVSVDRSEINFASDPDEEGLQDLDQKLRTMGLELVFDQRSVLIERMKSTIKNLVVDNNHPMKNNLSEYLSKEFRYNYSYLSTIFSEAEGITIRDYAIKMKIERVKEMLVFENQDLLEISYRLNYSSSAHLAAQFKKVTGMTTTEFKKQPFVGAGPRLQKVG